MSDTFVFLDVWYNVIHMSRTNRVDVGGEVYHCLNRTVGKQKVFIKDKDYQAFERMIEEVVDATGMRILAYCIMSNHFHFVLYPEEDGGLSDFMKKITLTHTQRYRVTTNTVGEGPIYQGRYKSFIVQDDTHLFTVLRYVECNPLTANLIKEPLDWKYSSLYRRYKGSEKQKQLLTPWIIEEPKDYLNILKNSLTPNELEKLERSENKGVPYGDEEYILNKVEEYKLQSTMRQKGRPRKE